MVMMIIMIQNYSLHVHLNGVDQFVKLHREKSEKKLTKLYSRIWLGDACHGCYHIIYMM